MVTTLPMLEIASTVSSSQQIIQSSIDKILKTWRLLDFCCVEYVNAHEDTVLKRNTVLRGSIASLRSNAGTWFSSSLLNQCSESEPLHLLSPIYIAVSAPPIV
ncbi:hypothetical protein VNO80_24599 [Phaseolus coccineus]|uniref:Uncharacterized protein n=1 Tax=Phaseolus coccineus TaxID=3886 RepID=A0AAN9LXJ9_PHACN